MVLSSRQSVAPPSSPQPHRSYAHPPARPRACLRIAGLLRFYLRTQAARHKGSAGNEQHGSELGAAEGVLSGEMLGAGASIVYERHHLLVRPCFPAPCSLHL